jgi:hypothetical protein
MTVHMTCSGPMRMSHDIERYHEYTDIETLIATSVSLLQNRRAGDYENYTAYED